MLDGRDQHAAPPLGLLRGAADILPIHGDRGAAPVPEAFRRLAPAARILFILRDFAWMLALLAGPVRQRGFQRLRRQGREDVVERRDRRVGVALPAGAVETACGLELLLAQQAGELREGRHAAVAGQPRGGLAQGRAGVGLQFEHENLLGLAVMEPGRRRTRLARIAAGHAQRAPVRGPVASPGKAGRVHERFRDQHGVSVRRQHVVRQPPQAQAEHPHARFGA